MTIAEILDEIVLKETGAELIMKTEEEAERWRNAAYYLMRGDKRYAYVSIAKDKNVLKLSLKMPPQPVEIKHG